VTVRSACPLQQAVAKARLFERLVFGGWRTLVKVVLLWSRSEKRGVVMKER